MNREPVAVMAVPSILSAWKRVLAIVLECLLIAGLPVAARIDGALLSVVAVIFGNLPHGKPQNR